MLEEKRLHARGVLQRSSRRLPAARTREIDDQHGPRRPNTGTWGRLERSFSLSASTDSEYHSGRREVAMSSKRDRKQHKRQTANAERQKIALGYLRRINIWREVQATPLAERLLQARAPKARIVLADDAVSDNEAASLAKDLGKCLRDTTFNTSNLSAGRSDDFRIVGVLPLDEFFDQVEQFRPLDTRSILVHRTIRVPERRITARVID